MLESGFIMVSTAYICREWQNKQFFGTFEMFKHTHLVWAYMYLPSDTKDINKVYKMVWQPGYIVSPNIGGTTLSVQTLVEQRDIFDISGQQMCQQVLIIFLSKAPTSNQALAQANPLSDLHFCFEHFLWSISLFNWPYTNFATKCLLKWPLRWPLTCTIHCNTSGDK